MLMVEYSWTPRWIFATFEIEPQLTSRLTMRGVEYADQKAARWAG